MAKNTRRKLAAILAADVVGYSLLMGEDEAGTLDALRTHREELIEPKIAEHEGRVVKLMGDGLLAEFPSAVEAVHCAIEIQHTMAERNADVPEERRITYRIGINIGDIVVEGDDIYGDGVNIAARLEGLADPGGICISRSVHTQIADKLDLEFEDLGQQQVKNIVKPVMVYRVALDEKAAALVTPVTVTPPTTGRGRWPQIAAGLVLSLVAVAGLVWWQPWAPGVEPASVERMAFPLPDKPSIAVLPFTNMSDDPGQEYFADGMTEDVITDLSKISGLFVIARNSSFSYKGQLVKVQQVAEELGVRYVLEGSVRRAGDQVRINAQLIDATTGGHLWAERYDGSMADVFALQDKVTQQIVTALAVSLSAEEQTEYDSTKTESPAAYDAFLRGWELYRRGTAEDFAAAIPFLEKAIKLDPNYGQAYAALAAVYWSSASNGWNKSLGLDINQTRNQARIHLRSAMKSPTALAFRVASERAAHYRRKADEAIEYAESAIALDANNPAGHLAMANALIKAGKPSDAVDSMHMAMRLDPHFPVAYLSRLGRAQFAMEEFHDAAATFERAADRDPNNDWTFVYLAAAYGHLNRAQQAKSAVQEANALRANMRWSALTLESLNIGSGGLGRGQPLRPERNLLREGLTKAGVKTGSEWTHLVTTTPTGQFEVEGATMIDVSTAKALHDRKVPFVDTRGLIALGRISRTHSLDLFNDFEEARLLEIAAKTQEIVIYGRAATRYPAMACAKAVNWGFERVYCFVAGFEEWRQAGYPIEKGN